MTKLELFATDIDNTLFDWVRYYTASFLALLRSVESVTGVPLATLSSEAREVFEGNGSIEYPFVIQELPSVVAYYGEDVDRMLDECVRKGRDAFLDAAAKVLKPYDDVVETLAALRARHPDAKVVALTDAPRYVAMWKLNKLGLLSYFDAVYGLPDPRIPMTATGKVKVDAEILQKHLRGFAFGFQGKIRSLPDEYEKPGVRGFKTVLMDFELDEPLNKRQGVVWVGDNRRKDVHLGARLGIRTAWAAYGAPRPADLAGLHTFSPALNIHKNAALPMDGTEDAHEPTYTLQTFADVLKFL